METRKRIQIVALDLFSKKGFKSTSVREIAALIGIKDSSLYFHYKNKQDILDSLMLDFVNISEGMMGFMYQMCDGITEISDDDFYNVTNQYIQSYFMNEFIGKFIMVMTHERSHNAQLQVEYLKWCIEKPIEFQCLIMKKLQDIDYLKKSDTQYMALQYYSPIFLFFNQYLAHEYNKENQELFLAKVMDATKKFIEVNKEVS